MTNLQPIITGLFTLEDELSTSLNLVFRLIYRTDLAYQSGWTESCGG